MTDKFLKLYVQPYFSLVNSISLSRSFSFGLGLKPIPFSLMDSARILDGSSTSRFGWAVTEKVPRPSIVTVLPSFQGFRYQKSQIFDHPFNIPIRESTGIGHLFCQHIEVDITITYGGNRILYLLFAGNIIIDFCEFVPYCHAVPFLLDLILLLVTSKVTTFYITDY